MTAQKPNNPTRSKKVKPIIIRGGPRVRVVRETGIDIATSSKREDVFIVPVATPEKESDK